MIYGTRLAIRNPEEAGGEGVSARKPGYRGGSGAAGLWADAGLGRGRAEGAEELVAEGAHGL